MKKVRAHVWRWMPLVSSIIFVGLIAIALWNLLYQYRANPFTTAAHDLEQIAKCIDQINKECGITAVDKDKNEINFLTVVTFNGSQVGPLHLQYPQRWKNCLSANPTIGGIEYQLVRTQKGYFVVPGDGVVLPNGKEIGKDIILDEKSNIEKMSAAKGPLDYNGVPLAVKVAIPLPGLVDLSSSLLPLEDGE